MTETPYFIFWCPNCNAAQHGAMPHYKGEKDGFEITKVICPTCCQEVTLQYETVTHAARRLRWGSN